MTEVPLIVIVFANKSVSWPVPPLKGGFEFQADLMTALEGQMKARQGRLAEAESDIRGALLSRLQQVGKYHASTAQLSRMLANLLAEQARYGEARDALDKSFLAGLKPKIPVRRQHKHPTTLVSHHEHVPCGVVVEDCRAQAHQAFRRTG